MPTVRGCHLPDDLYYDVDNHIWFREQPDGTVKLGMTKVATAMAGPPTRPRWRPTVSPAARARPAREVQGAR